MTGKENGFKDWFLKTWEETDGLISPATGAELLGIKRQSVNGMINTGKLKKYSYEGKTYISLKDIALIKVKRDSKRGKR